MLEEIDLPKISIVMVSYNQGMWIEKSILSLLNQNYPNLEFIVIDSDSQDNTKEILHKYSQHIDLCISESDRGMYHARNKGIFLATGDYIGFLNTDDLLFPEALLKVGVAILENNYPDMIYGYTVGLDKEDKEMNIIFGSNINISSKKYFSKMKTIPDQSTFYRKNAFSYIGLYDTNLKFGADTEIKGRFIFRKMKIITIPEILSGWRIYETSLTYRNDLKNQRFVEACKVNRRFNKSFLTYYNIRLLIYTYFIPIIKRFLKR